MVGNFAELLALYIAELGVVVVLTFSDAMRVFNDELCEIGDELPVINDEMCVFGDEIGEIGDALCVFDDDVLVIDFAMSGNENTAYAVVGSFFRRCT